MRVLQLIDSLDAGGAERVAVNIANALSTKVKGSFLCTTRKEGLLKESLLQEVGYLFLKKTKTIDLVAVKQLYKFIKVNKINIIHAHSTSFFLATLIKLLNPKIIVVWHDHFGDSEFLDTRKYVVLKWCSKFFNHIFSVNKSLQVWAIQMLDFKKVCYLPNFATINNKLPITNLKGAKKRRIICLANLRPQKDHITLLDAFKEVLMEYPEWTLHLVGKDFNDNYSKAVREKIKMLSLKKSVYCYGSQPDIYNILQQCEIGVLSSKSEGLPIALLEYGLANLAVIATKVGECETLIIDKVNGLLVSPSSPKALAKALRAYVKNEEMRLVFASNYNRHIEENFSEQLHVKTLLKIYKSYYKYT